MSDHSNEDIPITVDRGPSDPLVMADGPGTWAEIRIEAPPEQVWAAVTDIDLPARFSPEFQGAEWTSHERGVGATFTGRNRHPAIGEWEVTCHVDARAEPVCFGWRVSDPNHPGARWRFDLSPHDHGTLLRFSVALGPGRSGLTAAIESMPDKESRIIRRRLAEHHTNMTRTLEGIKQTLELRS